ncbi:MAG: hypothetical protein ACF788_04240 [Novipirellula sp. JB048]
MTLVELVLALSLAAMLLVATVGVLGQVHSQAELADAMVRPVWPSKVRGLLRRDFWECDQMWEADGIVWFATAGYRCVPEAGAEFSSDELPMGMLQRLSAKEGSAVEVATLAIGPDRVDVERVDDRGLSHPLPPRPGPVPKRLRVRIYRGERLELEAELVLQ